MAKSKKNKQANKPNLPATNTVISSQPTTQTAAAQTNRVVLNSAGKGSGTPGKSQIATVASKQPLPKPSQTKKSVAGPSTSTTKAQAPSPNNKTEPVSRQTPESAGISRIESTVLGIRKAISVLFMLTDAPVRPPSVLNLAPNWTDGTEVSQSHFSLAIEKELVEDFIFLSSTTTEPHKIRALCIERDTDHETEKFRIRIAANHGELATLKRGLEHIISNLKNCNSIDDSTSLWTPVTDVTKTPGTNSIALLRSIVTLNLNRIFCRLRSRHARWENFKKMKPQSTPVPHRVVAAFESARSERKGDTDLNASIEVLQHLFSLLEAEALTKIRLYSSPTVDIVVNLVRTVYCLWRRPSFSNIIQDEKLLRHLAKIARYVTVTLSLIKLRKSHPWLGSLTVEPVRLDVMNLPTVATTPNGFQRCMFDMHISPNLADQLSGQAGRLKNRKRTGMDQTRDDLDQRFTGLVNIKCAVHAEMQLLCHYELWGHKTAPRVIVSTKAPCFLCALFFTIHGHYLIPESHGRLYEKWTLPGCLKMLDAAKAHSILKVLNTFHDALTASITQVGLGLGAGKLLSTESFFRKSMIWARASQILTLEHFAEQLSTKAEPLLQKLHAHRPEFAKLLWSSTSMLVTSKKPSERGVRVSRGQSIAFQLTNLPTHPTIRTNSLQMFFTAEVHDDGNARPQIPRPAKQPMPILVKIWHHPRMNQIAQRIKPSPADQDSDSDHDRGLVEVDVARLQPGEEVVITTKASTPGADAITRLEGFALVHKEEHVFVQVHASGPGTMLG